MWVIMKKKCKKLINALKYFLSPIGLYQLRRGKGYKFVFVPVAH